jgi:hypothetical protein
VSDHLVSFETEAWRQTLDSAVWHESLRAATWNSHTEASKILIANDTGVQVREAAHYSRIIQAAALSGCEEILKAILDDDAHFRPQSREACSDALRQAVSLGDDAVVEILGDRDVRFAETELIRLGSMAEGAYLARLSALPPQSRRRSRLSSLLVRCQLKPRSRQIIGNC